MCYQHCYAVSVQNWLRSGEHPVSGTGYVFSALDSRYVLSALDVYFLDRMCINCTYHETYFQQGFYFVLRALVGIGLFCVFEHL